MGLLVGTSDGLKEGRVVGLIVIVGEDEMEGAGTGVLCGRGL